MKDDKKIKEIAEYFRNRIRQNREMARIIREGGDLEKFIKDEGIKFARPFKTKDEQ